MRVWNDGITVMLLSQTSPGGGARGQDAPGRAGAISTWGPTRVGDRLDVRALHPTNEHRTARHRPGQGQVVAVWERLDGKFVVHSNDDTLSAEDLASSCKQLQRVEQAWRQLKSRLRLRPVYHWAVHRIQAHIALTVIALLLECMAEEACEDTWRNIRDDLKRIQLAQLSGPNGTWWQVTKPCESAANRLKSLSRLTHQQHF